MLRTYRSRLLATIALGLAPATLDGQHLTAPALARMDEVVSVHLTALPPGHAIVLRASMPDSAGRTWRAESTLEPSVAAITADGTRLVSRTDLGERLGTAIFVPPGLADIPLTLALVIDGRTVDSAVVMRAWVAAGVHVAPLERSTGLVGTLFVPPGSRAITGILILGGSEGGNSAMDVAAQLASHGYTTLSLAYFGADSLPAAIDELPLEYFERAIALLRRQPHVDATRIVVFGTSKGAEAALLLASRDRGIRAVLAYAPSSVVWSCVCTTEHSSWSVAGSGLASVPPGTDPSYQPIAGQPLHPVVNYRYRLRDTAVVARATYQSSRSTGRSCSSPAMPTSCGRRARWRSRSKHGARHRNE